mmetsp:Transcript_14621/g.40629  ORF Transcript_14621/g.40629 Transcript_14621/m.40629 type:complete len:209 (-) Transcript_14621:1179-1805(-)
MSCCIIFEASDVLVAPAVGKPFPARMNKYYANHIGEASYTKNVDSTGQHLLVGRRGGESDLIGSADRKYFTKADQNVGGCLPEHVDLFSGPLVGGMDHELDNHRPRHRTGSQRTSNRKLVCCRDFDATPCQIRVDVIGSDRTKNQHAQCVETVHAGNIKNAKCLGHDSSLNLKGCGHLVVTNTKGNHAKRNEQTVEECRRFWADFSDT